MGWGKCALTAERNVTSPSSKARLGREGCCAGCLAAAQCSTKTQRFITDTKAKSRTWFPLSWVRQGTGHRSVAFTLWIPQWLPSSHFGRPNPGRRHTHCSTMSHLSGLLVRRSEPALSSSGHGEPPQNTSSRDPCWHGSEVLHFYLRVKVAVLSLEGCKSCNVYAVTSKAKDGGNFLDLVIWEFLSFLLQGDSKVRGVIHGRAPVPCECEALHLITGITGPLRVFLGMPPPPYSYKLMITRAKRIQHLKSSAHTK